MPETFEIATDNEKLDELVDCTSQKLANNVGELVECTRQKLVDNLGVYRRKTIFRVPEQFIKIDRRAYAPVCLSIGPYHYPKGEGKEYLLNDFILRSARPLGDYYSKLITHEREFRDCYEKIKPEISQHFLEILLFDSVFLLYMIDLIHDENEEYKGPELTLDHYRDIFLVENQNPFDVLNKVYTVYTTSHGDKQEQPLALLLGKKLIDYFECVAIPIVAPERDTNPVHLLHLVHSCLVPVKERNSITVLDFNPSDNFLRWHRAVEYHKTGVKFKRMDLQTSGPHTLLDIEFKDGVLSIPMFSIEEFTNLLTFELLTPERGVRKYVTAYILFMSQLLSMPEDVALLSYNGIIKHQFGRDDHVSELFENLAQGLPVFASSYYEMSFGWELEKHYCSRWNEWMAWLKREYLKNPWRIMALLATTILLVFQLLQGIFSVLLCTTATSRYW